MGDSAIYAGLGVILALVLILPFASKKVEHNLEVFLFIMGLASSLVSGVLGLELGMKALEEPIMISAAVLVAGMLFKALQKYIKGAIDGLLKVMPVRVFMFLLVVILGLASSVITAIIASLVLVEIISVLRLNRKAEVNLDIIACFAIGLGAALTPIGEPLATIAVSKLNKDFWYLMSSIGPYIVPGILALGAFAAFYIKAHEVRPAAVPRSEAAASSDETTLEAPREEENYWAVVVRALKVYLFVMALVLLGEGFKPAIDRFVIGLPSSVLYWLNTVSAVLDNATLTAAEISNKMSDLQIKSVLMGLLISGGMLIPGNIPNIISAGKLKIGSKEWAVLGVPLGLAIMLIYFLILLV